jgi:hypothetical protein
MKKILILVRLFNDSNQSLLFIDNIAYSNNKDNIMSVFFSFTDYNI